jgi:hypothetical protein
MNKSINNESINNNTWIDSFTNKKKEIINALYDIESGKWSYNHQPRNNEILFDWDLVTIKENNSDLAKKNDALKLLYTRYKTDR